MTPEMLAKIYHPLTANTDEGYREIEPCEALKPWIRCFWISDTQQDHIVIPDTCMDIIMRLDKNGRPLDSFFCGINDFTFTSTRRQAQEEVVLIGIRFHFWAVASFCAASLKNIRNTIDQMEYQFPGWTAELQNMAAEALNTDHLWPLWERYLLNRQHANPIPESVLKAAALIIENRGMRPVASLAEQLGVNKRWLERKFLDSYGVSCKRLSLLVRYQLIWQQCLKNHNFNVQDTVIDYGFYDQSHLLNFFRKYHSAGGLSHFSKTQTRPMPTIKDGGLLK